MHTLSQMSSISARNTFMLHVSGMVPDDASPSVLGHLSKNIRIAVLKTPIVDEDVGVAASIRIVNPQSTKKQDFMPED